MEQTTSVVVLVGEASRGGAKKSKEEENNCRHFSFQLKSLNFWSCEDWLSRINREKMLFGRWENLFLLPFLSKV